MANNQYVNKVVFGDETLIDLTSDTVNSGNLLEGVTAHSCTGQVITGTIQNKSPDPGFRNGRLEINFPWGCYSGFMHLENITVPVPTSGTNSITIKVPNGTANPNSSNSEDWIAVTFVVDSSGNSEIFTPTNEST